MAGSFITMTLPMRREGMSAAYLQQAVGSGQWAVGSGQWAVGSGQLVE